LVVLCLALLLLFFPIKYIGKSDIRDKQVTYHCKFWWLLHIIHISVEGENADGQAVVRVFGIPVYRKNFREEEEAEEAVQETTAAVERPATSDITQNTGISEGAPKPQQTETAEEKDEPEKIPFTEKVKQIIAKIKEFIQTVKDMYSSSKEKAVAAKKKFDHTKRVLKAKTTKRAYLYVKEMVIKLLKHIRPKKVEGELDFGMEQPDQTGQILGYVSMAAAMFRIPLNRMNIHPDFEKKVLEGYLNIKGRFLLGIVLVYLLKVYFNRDVKLVMKKLGK
jgi:hypothetical protein